MEPCTYLTLTQSVDGNFGDFDLFNIVPCRPILLK